MKNGSVKTKKINDSNSLELQLAQKDAELKIINSVGEAMSKQLDINTVTKIVGDHVREIFNTQVTEILLIDNDSNLINVPYSFYNGYQKVEPFKLGEGLTSKVINSRKPLLIGTFERSLELGVLIDSDEEKTESYLGVPILFGDKVLGVVSIQSYDQNVYDEDHVRLLSTLSTNMGVALQNAKLFETSEHLLNETKQRNAELGVINSVQEGLAKELDINGIYELVGEKIREIFNAQVVDIVLYNKESNAIEDCYAFEKGDRTLIGKRKLVGFRKHVIETAKSLVVNSNAEAESKKYGNPVVIGELSKSSLFVPILTGGEATHVISLQNLDIENAFNDSDVRLLTTLANSMSVALKNATLFDETNRLLSETKQRNAELGVINSVQEGLVKQVELQAIYDLVGEQIHEIFDTQVVAIASFDHESKTEKFNYVIEKGERYYPESRKYDKVREYLIKNKEMILINENYSEAAKKYGMKVVEGTEMPKSLLFVPLVVGKKVNGYITLQNIDRENAFSDSDVRLLNTLVNSMSVALENARLFDETNKLLDETKQQAIELGIINSVGEGLAEKLDYQSIIDLVGEKIKEVFNAEVVSISTYDKKNDEIHHRYVIEKGERFYFDKPQGIDADRKEIIETKQPLVFNTAQEAIEHSGEAVVAGEMPESFMGVPIIRNQEATGVITVQDIERQNLYTQKDLRLLMTLASNMGVALENARLFEETKRLLNETQQRNAELGVINSVQDGLVKQVELQEIYNLIGDKIKEIFDTHAVIIASFDKEKKEEIFNYMFEKGERFYPAPRKYDKVREYLIKNKKLIHLNKITAEEMEKLGGKVIPGSEMPKSVLFVPLTVADNVFGYISLQNIEKENAFSESSVRLLSTITNSMSVAIENARLFNQTKSLLKEMQQRNAELGVINSVQEGLAKELDMHGIYSLVGERLCSLFPDSQTLVIRTFDHVGGMEHWQYAIEKGKLLDVAPRPLNWNSKQLIKSKEPILINKDYVKTAQKYGSAGVTKGKPPKSAVFVPMMIGDTVGGSISLQNVDRENAFTDSDLRLLTTITNSMIVALENARLFEETNRLLKETEQRNTELSIINIIQEGMVKEMDFNGVINLVGDKLQEVLDYKDIGIRIYDNETKLVHFPYEYEHGEKLELDPMPPGPISKYVLEKKEILLVENNNQETFDKLGLGGNVVIPGTDRSKSFIAVPLISGNESRGMFIIENYERENAFSETDIRLLTTLANSMSVAIENARLFNETNRLLDETQQRNVELSILNTIQEGLVMEMEFEAIINLVGDKLREALGFQDLGIRIYDKENDKLQYTYEYEHGKRLYIDSTEPTPLSRYVIDSGKMLLLKKATDEEIAKLGITGQTTIPGTDESKSLVFVPIKVGQDVKGLILIEDYEKEDAFSDSDIRLLTTVANSMSVALENARLFNETLRLLDESKKRAAELSTVNSISQAIVGHLEIDKLINLVGDKVRSLFKANIVYVALLNKETQMIEFPYGYGDEYPPLKLGDGLTSKIILNKEPLLSNRKMNAREEKIIGTPSSSYLGVPIPVGDEIIGVLSVQSTEKENVFNEDDMRLLNTIAAHVGIAINNANSYEELNKTLENLQATQNQLVAQEKLASLGQLTAGIAHEIKNPLNFVNNFSELSVGLVEELEEEIGKINKEIKEESSEEIKEILASLKQNSEKIKEHGKRADSIVHSMLQHSRGKSGEKQPTDINAMLDEDLNLVYHGMRAQDSTFNIKIVREYEKDLPEVHVVPQDMSRVFLNIMSNGCYEAHRKKVEKNSSDPAVIKITSTNTDKYVEVRVRDNGNGVPQHIRENLFTPFFTTKPTGKGTGLGLSISYDIVVSEHNGELLFETEDGKFTEFIIRLPKKTNNNKI